VAGVQDLNKITEILQDRISEAEEELRRFQMADLDAKNEQWMKDEAAREVVTGERTGDLPLDD
jgi:hypothetical protein